MDKKQGKSEKCTLLNVLAAPSLGTRNTPVSGASSVPGRAAPGLQLGLAVMCNTQTQIHASFVWSRHDMPT